MKKLVTSLFIFLPFLFSAQLDLTNHWHYGGSELDRGFDLIYDGNDDTYVIISISRSANIDLESNNGFNDYWIKKIDASGNIIWAISLGGQGDDAPYDIIQLADGSYLVAGYSSSNTGDFNAGYGLFDGWIMNITTDGQVGWKRNYGGSGNDAIRSLALMTDGNIAFCGNSASEDYDLFENHGVEDAWVGVISASGDVLWSQSYGGSDYDIFESLVINSANEIILTGHSFSTDVDIASNQGSSDIWVYKLDAGGGVLSNISIGGFGADYSNKIILSPDEDLIITGYEESDTGIFSENAGSFDSYVLRLGADFDFQWIKVYGSILFEQFQEIIWSPDNTIILGGLSYSEDGDLPGNAGKSDAWLLEIDQSGEILNSQNFGGSENDFILSLALKENQLAFVGGSESSDGDLADHYGNGDVWLATVDAGFTAVEEALISERWFEVYPNPASNQIELSLNGGPVQSGIVHLFHESGKLVLIENLDGTLLDISGLSPNIYYLKLIQDKQVYWSRFVRID